MRRKDREITDPQKKHEIIRKCEVIRIALFDEEFPYIVPLNFGYLKEKRVFYLHCADEGKKINLIKKNNKVAFELDMDLKLDISENSCHCTMKYKSIQGTGKIFIVEDDDEKNLGLNLIIQQYRPQLKAIDFTNELNSVVVLKLEMDTLTCKVNT